MQDYDKNIIQEKELVIYVTQGHNITTV